MKYNRDNFCPIISTKSLKIKFNEEIMGFIMIPEKLTDQEQSFFTSIDRKKINKSL